MNEIKPKPNISEKLKLDSNKKKTKKNKKKRRLYIALAFFGVIILGFVSHSKPELETTFVINERIGEAANPLLRASGYITYPQEIEIGTQQRGPVLDILFDEGDLVKAGDLLAILDNTELLVQKKLQEKVKQNAERVLQRTQKLNRAGSASDAELESATIDYDNAAISLELLNEQIEKTKIKAPVAGKIIEKSIEVGELVNGVIAVMIDNSTTLVEVNINQNDIAKISNKQPAVVTLDAFPKTEYAGCVWKVAESGDRARNTVEVKVQVLYPDQKFKPGLSAKVYFVNNLMNNNSEIKTRLIVPKTAVFFEDGKQKVWRIENDNLLPTEVQTGQELRDGIEIIAGLSSDDKIVKNPANSSLKSGIKNSHFNIVDWLRH